MRDDSEAILDALLVLKCRRGDSTAWRELVSRYERRLLYFIRRIVGNERDAWDLLQQTWLAALNALAGLDDPKLLRTWLYRIARNLAISHLRKHQRDAMSVDPDDLKELPQLSEEEPEYPWPEEAPQRLHGAIEQLSVRHREVITLYFLEDATVDQIAQVIGVPPGTIKSRLHYAKRALRDILQREAQ